MNSTIEKARQSASQVIDEAKQRVDGLSGPTVEGKPQDSGEKGDATHQQDDEVPVQTNEDKSRDD